MKSFRFIEATLLLTFIENYKDQIISQPLQELYTNFWPLNNRTVLSDEPVIIRLDNCLLVVHYLIYSDIRIDVCSEEELKQDESCANMLQIKREVHDYYSKEFGDGVQKEQIEGCIITDVEVERFSEAFECNTRGDMRPAGGDYFSTIRLCLDSGKKLCFCGVDSISDGYIEIWCE